MPIILSFNINVTNYNELPKNKAFINKIFKVNIKLYETNYHLIGLVTQPSANHVVSYFNKNNGNNWFKFDDFKGYYVKLIMLKLQ